MEYMAPAIIRRMRREIPNLQVRLLSGNNLRVIEMMGRQEIDAAVWVGTPVENPQLVLLPFFDEERCVLCPADTPLPDRPIQPSELDGRYEIRYSYVSTTAPVEPAPWRREYFPERVTPWVRIENYMAASEYMDDRRCWCIAPEKIVRWSMGRRPGALTLRRLDPAPPVQKNWLLTHKSQLSTPVFQCFLRCCDAWLDEAPYLHKTLVL